MRSFSRSFLRCGNNLFLWNSQFQQLNYNNFNEALGYTTIRDTSLVVYGDLIHLVEIGTIVQTEFRFTSSLVVKMLAVVVSTISNSQVFCWKKMCVAFAHAKATHIFFSKNISVYAIFNDQSFSDALTNGMVSFEQLGPVVQRIQRFVTSCLCSCTPNPFWKAIYSPA